MNIVMLYLNILIEGIVVKMYKYINLSNVLIKEFFNIIFCLFKLFNILNIVKEVKKMGVGIEVNLM